MPNTHGAIEGASEFEYVTAYQYKWPHQSNRVAINQTNKVQTLKFKEKKVVKVRNCKALRISALIEEHLPAADGWVVDAGVQPARALSDGTNLDLWHFSVTGTRNVTS